VKAILARIARQLKDGILDQNPVAVQALCLCPAVAVSARLVDSLTLGLCTLAVLVLSSVTVSALKGLLPAPIRLPGTMVLIATFVSMAGMALAVLRPEQAASIGIYLPLIAVGGLPLLEAEASAAQKSVPRALLDAVSLGLGLVLIMALTGALREILGSGTVLGTPVFEGWLKALPFFTQPAGGFIALGLVAALIQGIRNAASRTREEDEPS